METSWILCIRREIRNQASRYPPVPRWTLCCPAAPLPDGRPGTPWGPKRGKWCGHTHLKVSYTEDREKIFGYPDQERLRTSILAEAAPGLQYADHFVACSPHSFVNTICAEIESRQDALFYEVIMWPGWSHKHNSPWLCCLLWIDPCNHDSPSICCWWLISKGVPGVANSLFLSLSLSDEMWPGLVFIAESQLYPDWHCSMG